MKVKVQTSKIVKPSYGDGDAPPTTDVVPLSVFDKANFDTYVSVVYAFRPPAPPNAVLEEGLNKALAEYREWAGRFGEDADGNRAILLNDEGARLVEATADTTLNNAMPFKPTPALLSLHPSDDGVAELLLVQFTRFSCGSLVLGFTAHHLVSDGRATSNFLLAWGQASRGLPITPTPVHDRATLFTPRDTPRFDFEHRGAEFVTKKTTDDHKVVNPLKDEVVVHKVHFTKDFLSRLKSKASVGADRPYSTFQCLVAHLWRSITKARGLNGCETTHVRIAVDGRMRMVPHVPDGYTGNVVLWAFPRSNVWELITKPLQYAVELIHREVHKVNDTYFKSFIDFANSDVVKKERLVSSADAADMVLCPNLEVDSWLRIPFYDLDFGGGSPYFFVPSYLPVEGLLILLPSFFGDGSIDAYIPLFSHNVDTFKSCCYSLD